MAPKKPISAHEETEREREGALKMRDVVLRL